jgi:hypothetical protein
MPPLDPSSSPPAHLTFWLGLLSLATAQAAGGALALALLRAKRHASAGHPARWALAAWGAFPLSFALYTTTYTASSAAEGLLEGVGLSAWALAPLEALAFAYGVTRLARWAARE